jgi:hypothetical protein
MYAGFVKKKEETVVSDTYISYWIKFGSRFSHASATDAASEHIRIRSYMLEGG